MVEFQRLEADLRRAVSGEVRFDKGMRAVYSADASNYRQVPIGVVLPRTIEDVVETVRLCASHGAPLLARGGATSLNGQAVNVAVVIDCSKYLGRVLSIDARAGLARVEPGVVCDALRDAAEAHGLTFAPDPATHSRCTLGGMIGNNSCGPHSVMAGTTVDNIERLEVLTYDGVRFWCGPTSDSEFHRIVAAGGRRAEIYLRLRAIADHYADLIRARFPKIKRRVSGYNLDQLLPENGFNVARALVGSEGTCALTLQAEARLVKSPRSRVLVVLGFPDIAAAGDAVPQLLAAGPIACEGLDEAIIGGLRERRLRFGDRAQPRRQGRRSGGRLGGRGGRSSAPRRLPARVPGARRAFRLPHFALRPLRRRLHPRAHQLRAAHAGGGWPPAGLFFRGGAAGGEGRRAPAADVRPGADAGVPRVQSRMGPAEPHEPGQAHRCIPARCQPAPGAGIQAGGAENETFLQKRSRRRLHPRERALHRHGQVPQPHGRHDVPELPRDARGALLDARPLAAARRDAAR